MSLAGIGTSIRMLEVANDKILNVIDLLKSGQASDMSMAKLEAEGASTIIKGQIQQFTGISKQLAKSAGYGPEYRPSSPRGARPASPRGGDLWSMTVSQLRDLARQRGVGGYTGKTKAELVAMLQ